MTDLDAADVSLAVAQGRAELLGELLDRAPTAEAREWVESELREAIAALAAEVVGADAAIADHLAP